ncbi:condensation domain-containing protein [Luedemannella flava]
MGGLIEVPFAGEGAGEGGLTWGQQRIWAEIQCSGGALNMGGIMPMPPTTTIDEITRLLAFIMGRHPSLRTRLRFTPDGDPRQVVSAAGVATLEVIDVEDVDPAELVARYAAGRFAGDLPLVLADPARVSADEVAEGVQMRFWEPFDEERDWPVRMAVIRVAGTITHLVVMYNHVVIDGEGLGVLVADLATMDPATGTATAPPPGPTPLELVELQRTPAHQRRSEAALRHWEKALRTVPARPYGGPYPPQELRFWELEYESPAAELAMHAIAARCRVDAKPVMLAVFALAMYRLTGVHPSAAQILVNNRFRPGLSDTISPLNQAGLCVLDVDGVPFDEIVARAARAVMNAGMYAYYDMARHRELVAAVGRERGEQLELTCFLNDRRTAVRPDPDRVPTPQDVRAALPQSQLRWRRRVDRPNKGMYLHVLEKTGTCWLLLTVDTADVPPDDMVRLVREVEAVAVEAVVGERVRG